MARITHYFLVGPALRAVKLCGLSTGPSKPQAPVPCMSTIGIDGFWPNREWTMNISVAQRKNVKCLRPVWDANRRCFAFRLLLATGSIWCPWSHSIARLCCRGDLAACLQHCHHRYSWPHWQPDRWHAGRSRILHSTHDASDERVYMMVWCSSWGIYRLLNCS
jgi:hypothetical protein